MQAKSLGTALGRKVSNGLTHEQMMKTADVDWKVHEAPSYVALQQPNYSHLPEDHAIRTVATSYSLDATPFSVSINSVTVSQGFVT